MGPSTHPWIDPDFAAAVLVAVGQHYRDWGLAETAGMRAEQALAGVASRLVEDLLPLAKDRIIVFSPPEPPTAERWPRFRNTDQHAVVRFTPELVRTVARLAAIVREEGVVFAAHGLGSDHQFWRVRWAHDPDRSVAGRTCLCISAAEAGVCYDDCDSLIGEPKSVETAPVPLERIAPVDLLGRRHIEITAAAARTYQAPFAKRLQAYLRAEQAFDIAEYAWLNSDQAVDPERLNPAVALWWGQEQYSALDTVRSLAYLKSVARTGASAHLRPPGADWRCAMADSTGSVRRADRTTDAGSIAVKACAHPKSRRSTNQDERRRQVR